MEILVKLMTSVTEVPFIICAGLNESGPHRHIFEYLGGVALLEYAWACWRKYVVGGGL